MNIVTHSTMCSTMYENNYCLEIKYFAINTLEKQNYNIYYARYYANSDYLLIFLIFGSVI